MKKNLILSLCFCLSLSFVSAYQADFAIYTGSGTWEHSITAFEHFLQWKGLSYREVSAWDLNNVPLSGNYRGLFMPGGWAYDYKKSIRDSGDQNIRDFISGGGSYIGMSAGAYYACDNVRWEGTDYPYYLNLFHGDCVGPVPEIAPWPNYVMTRMSINQAHEANIYEGASEDVLYYGEPYFAPYAGQEMQTFASWNIPANPSADHQPGIIGFNYGAGRVLLVGPHPEIEEDSDRDGNSFGEELNDNGSDWPFLWTATDWLLHLPISQPRELPQGSGSTGDTIPPQILSYSAAPSLLSAGSSVLLRAEVVDNVGVRYVRVGILDQVYPMVREVVPGSIIFTDTFESGTLSGWTLTHASGGLDWTNVNSNSYQGSRHAQSQPRSTTEPASIMERTISTTQQEGIRVTYARKLVGLDAADEFKVKWFDGLSWNVLEQTGSNSANDAAYILRNFTLPSSANNNPNFKLRFECTAGAVSEFCHIDNVQVSSSSHPTNFYRFFFDTTGLTPDTYGYTLYTADAAGNQPTPQGGEFTVR